MLGLHSQSYSSLMKICTEAEKVGVGFVVHVTFTMTNEIVSFMFRYNFSFVFEALFKVGPDNLLQQECVQVEGSVYRCHQN